MKRTWQSNFLACMAAALVAVILGGALGARGSQQGPPDPDPRAQQIQALSNALNQEREKTEALATSAASLRAELQRTRDSLAPACIAAVEKANAGKVVNPATLVLSDKPAAEKPDPKKGGDE